MLKIKSILVSLLALGAMASCSTNELEGEDTRTGADLDVAYMTYPEGKYPCCRYFYGKRSYRT